MQFTEYTEEAQRCTEQKSYFSLCALRLLCVLCEPNDYFISIITFIACCVRMSSTPWANSVSGKR